MPNANTKGKQPHAKLPKRPALEKPSYIPQMGSLNFAAVIAFLKLGAVPSQGGSCSRAQLLAAVKELQSEWEGVEDLPLAVKDDPEAMVDLPMVREHMPSRVTRLQNVEYKLKHRKEGSIMAKTCRDPKLRLSEEGEATACYLLERHLRKYKTPMPGFEDFSIGGEEDEEVAEEEEGEVEEEEVLVTPTMAVPSRGSKRSRRPSARAAAAAAGGGCEEQEEEGREEEEQLVTPTKAAPAKRSRRPSARAVEAAAAEGSGEEEEGDGASLPARRHHSALRGCS